MSRSSKAKYVSAYVLLILAIKMALKKHRLGTRLIYCQASL